MKIISFAAARKLRYYRLCNEHGYTGGLRDGWGDDSGPHCDNHFDDIAGVEGYPSDKGRFALVENGRYGQTWITLHDSLEAAANYNGNQEYAEDWMDANICDLADGQWYGIEYKAVAFRIAEGVR